MPSVVAGAVVGAIGLSGVVGTVVTAVIGAGMSMAVNSLVIKPTKRRGTSLSASERTEIVRSAVTPRRIIYGRARVAGPLVFAYTTDAPDTGRKNQILHMIVPVAAHEVHGYGHIFINDELTLLSPIAGSDGWKVPPVGSRYLFNNRQQTGVSAVNGIQYREYYGTATQTADAYLRRDVPVWTANHRLQGTAYIYFKLGWDQNMWAGGLPNLSMIVDGRKLYDPRTGTTYWGNNPALCIRDYLLSDFGLSCQPDEIDEDSFIAAANLCDEVVVHPNGVQYRRYNCNGVISLDEKPIDIMEKLLSTCAGALVYSQGKYRLYPAALRTPVVSIDDSQLRGPVVVRPQPPRRERVNTVRGTYIEQTINWQASEFGAVTSPSYVAQDGGITYTHDLDLPFTIDVHMAQRLARLQLERSRRALTVEVPCNLSALDVAVMEPVRLSVQQLGWVDKTFIPTEWKLSPEGGVDLVMIEDDPGLYTIYNSPVADVPPTLVLPNIYPDAPLLSLSEHDGSLVVALTGLNDAFISQTEVQYRLLGESVWESAGSGEVVAIASVSAGQTYELRARVINTLGIASGWATASRQIIGNAAPPADIAVLQGSLVDSTLYLSWAAPQGVGLRYRLRWSPLTSGAIWTSAVDVAGAITSTQASVPARLGSYMLKALDAFGRESANAVSYVNLTPDPRGANVVATLSEAPAFSGAKSNASVNGANQLVIASLMAFDAQAGNLDSASGNFDSAGGGLSPEGVYEFASVLDLGASYIARISAAVEADVIDLVTDIDGATDSFDTRQGNFDGAAPSAVDVLVEVSTTAGDPAGSPSWSSWQAISVGDFVGRGFRFRARLISTNPMATPAVTALSVSLDMPDRVAAANGSVSASGGDSITFTPAFKATPAISITPSNLTSGDYFTITSQSRSGFTVQFKNSAGTGISRTYDWVARGYGRQQ